jgi:hypothetical protein
MSTSYYDFYCDESATHGGGSFYFGALYCSPVRAKILRAGLKEVRERYGCRREMKWTKVSVKMLPAYTAFANVFLDDPVAQFIIMKVSRGKMWYSWAPDEEQRFFKAYYVFLRMNMSMFSRYGVYIDYKPGKWYRWSALKFALNNAAIRDDYPLKRSHIHTLKPTNSKADDLIQLVDVLLGAITSSATAPAKTQLAQHIRQRLGDITRSHKPKFTVYDWTPTKSKTNPSRRR